MPALIAARGRRAGSGLPSELDAAGVVLVDAEDGAGDLGATGTDQAREADDLAGAHLEGHVVERARPS